MTTENRKTAESTVAASTAAASTAAASTAAASTAAAKVLYTARVRTTGGRDGASRSADGRLDIKHSSPGSAGTGTNPEQLFAAGWSACFLGAMGLAARRMKLAFPADAALDAEVDLCSAGGDYFLQARLDVSLPGVAREAAQALVDAAHQTCPYSRATRGNIDVVIRLL
jgi:lipoyl-dependent peroxiredoxin